MIRSTDPVFRGAVSVAANLTRGALSFGTSLLVARALGAARYGDYAFLLGTFSALALLLDAGTTSAFYTMLSARPRGPRFFVLYALWTVGMQFVVTFLAIAFVLPDHAVHRIWLGMDRNLVLLSLASSFVVTQVWMTITQMAEAVRKTIFIQAVGTAQVIAHLLLIILAFHFQRLTLPLLLALPIFEFLLLAIVLLPRLLRLNLRPIYDPEPRESFGRVASEFFSYCRPLILYSVVSFMFQFADRWFLQNFGGAVQQGYFAVGQQFANVANLLTASILAVVWKEVAESFHRGDLDRVRTIFAGVRRGVFFSAAAVSVFLLPYIRILLGSTLGSQFAAATLCVGLMFFYPLHQAIGQFQGTFLLATGSTTAYSVIGVVAMLVSIPVAYLLIALPTSPVPGLGLGAVGLAVKLVVLQIAAVTAQFAVLRRLYGFSWQFHYELGVVALLVMFSFAVKWAGTGILGLIGLPVGALASVGAGGVLYSILLVVLITTYPQIIGVTSMQRDVVVRAARRLVTRAA